MTDTWYIAQAPSKMALAAHLLRERGAEVWIPTTRFREWWRNRRVLKDRKVFYDYLFVRGCQPWTIPHVEGIQCLVLDADGLPAEIPDSALERFRPKLGEKPKVRIYLRGQRVRVTEGPLSGMTLPVHVHKPHQRSITLDGPNGSVRLSDSVVEGV